MNVSFGWVSLWHHLCYFSIILECFNLESISFVERYIDNLWFISVLRAPTPPRNIMAKIVSLMREGFVNITWDVPESTYGVITSYKVMH